MNLVQSDCGLEHFPVSKDWVYRKKEEEEKEFLNVEFLVSRNPFHLQNWLAKDSDGWYSFIHPI